MKVIKRENKFIRTTDEQTKDKLLAEGFTLLSSDNNGWTFINDGNEKATFSKKKAVYTNTLYG